MSNRTNIYPMAYVPDNETVCTLYYVGFPKAWKEKLIEIEKIAKPRWDGTYALPTYALRNSLGAWMDGVIDLTPLRAESNDEMWAISCEQDIDVQKLCEHIEIWLHSYYLGNSRLPLAAKQKTEQLLSEICVEELEKLKGCKEVKLFDENGIPTENYSYSAFTLMVTKALTGKSIYIAGREIKFNYAGKNQLISDIQEERKYSYSYGLSFSLQTTPPERKSLLLCDCCIHRWIPGNAAKKRNKDPFLTENTIAHVWVGNNKIYKLPIYQKYRGGDKLTEYFWEETEEKYYNLYNSKTLPSAREVIVSIDSYLSGEMKITCLYKNGMSGNGFEENVIGTGVSVVEKKDIFDGVFSHISQMVHQTEMPVRIERGMPNAKLKVDEINFNKGLDDEQRLLVAERMRECIEADILHLEVYYTDNNKECAQKIILKMQKIFQSTDDMTFDIKMCKLGSMGEPLESTRSAAVLKRIKEIEKKVDLAEETTACIVILPGKGKFKQEDPKAAIRCGFALKNRLTQFITPWEPVEEYNEEIKNGKKKSESADKVSKATIESKITSAIEDLCRQLGYIRALNEKTIAKENMLVHTPAIGINVMTQIKTLYGKARFLPLCVELDYISGKIYVECDAFENVRVPYRKAGFELAKLSMDRDFEKKCDSASRGMFKQKMIMWKNVYKNKNLLVMIEANGNTRALCHGITDSQIQKYTYSEPYCPQEIEVGTKQNSYKVSLNDSKVRFIRVRRNGEVPDYYTDPSVKNDGYASTSGLFKYGDVYWSVAARPKNKAYECSYRNSTYSKPEQNFAERDMIEFYPIQLQQGDNPNEWVRYANSLRTGAIQYDEATVLPIPIHMAAKLEEYILQI